VVANVCIYSGVGLLGCCAFTTLMNGSTTFHFFVIHDFFLLKGTIDYLAC
jgi:hypothetical protein